MSRRRMLVLLAMAMAAPAATWAAGGMVTEVFTIGYRPADEMVRILRPMVPSPGSVSAAYGKIVVRTTPENMREVKTILASLNRAPASLLISVRNTMNEEVRRDLYEAFGQVSGDNVGISTGRGAGDDRGLVITGGEGDNQAGVRVVQGDSMASGGGTQRVRVVEGREAFIQAGQSVPVTDERVIVSSSGVTTVRRSTGYRNVSRGFYVRARTNGTDSVTVEIYPQNNRLAGDSGAMHLREASTVVTSPLGRWVEIGRVDESSRRSTGEIGAASSSTARSGRVTYLKVDRLDQ